MSAVSPDARREVEAVLEATLRREALRNERVISWFRAAALVATAASDLMSHLWPRAVVGLESVPVRLPLVSGGLALYAVAVLVLLRRGAYPAWLRVLLPVLDALMVLAGFSNARSVLGDDEFRRVGGLATVGAACALLAMGGGLRLSRTSALASTVSALGVYAIFAFGLAHPTHNLAIQMAVLATAGAAGFWVSTIVRRTAAGAIARATLERFLPAGVVERAHEDPLSILAEPRAVEATVLVSDLRGSTAAAEGLAPATVLGLLNEVQGRLAQAVRRHGGTVDKFLGDGMLAVFGAPEPLPGHAAAALRAAREMLEAVQDLSDRRVAAGGARTALGVGVHTGLVVCGCLGGGARLEFTVIGDTVNAASRLQDLTKELGVSLLASGATVGAAGAAAAGLESRGTVALRGRSAALEVFGFGQTKPA